jgi:glycosyltransferase involved in cell wall biosynthesis
MPPLSHRLQVGYSGHLYEGRGLEVIAGVAERLHDVDFHVIGGEDTDVVRSRARWGACPNLTFHGYVPHARVARLLAGFHVLLAPYQEKVFVQGGAETASVMSPLKLFEYMSAGRAIIASDLPALREVLDDDVALFAAAADVNSWTDAIVKTRDDALLRQRLGERARARFLARYTWPARARRVLEGLQ